MVFPPPSLVYCCALPEVAAQAPYFSIVTFSPPP